MTTVKRKRGYQRGYPVAVLVGFEKDSVMLWRIFSRVVKPYTQLTLGADRGNKRAQYNFHESVVDALRPILAEGIRSIVITTPPKTAYGKAFFKHLQKHHAYLLQSKGQHTIAVGELVGSATQLQDVNTLVNSHEFRKLLTETTAEDAEHLVSVLENHLFRRTSQAAVLYQLDEIENVMYRRNNPEIVRNSYLILTEQYLTSSSEKTRLHRLLQVSNNRYVKTRIVKTDTPAGQRITQFGGIAFFTIAS